MMSRRKLICRVAALATVAGVAWGTLQAPAQAQGGDIVIFAAASLTDALDAINGGIQGAGLRRPKPKLVQLGSHTVGPGSILPEKRMAFG